MGRGLGDAIHAGIGTGLEEKIVSHSRWQERSVALAAGRAGGDDWQFVVVDVHEFAEIFRGSPVACHAHCNKLANKVDPSGCEVLDSRRPYSRGWMSGS